jgi:hypothetical protein
MRDYFKTFVFFFVFRKVFSTLLVGLSIMVHNFVYIYAVFWTKTIPITPALFIDVV